MSWPSWMPLAARPATWIDWSATFRDVFPRAWPARLYVSGSDAYSDLVAFGESMALARDMVGVLTHNIWPAADANDHLFIDRWEEVFDLQPDGSFDERTSRLIAIMRQRGTMTQDLVRAIMCRAWNTDDPGAVSLSSPAATPAPQCEVHGAFQGSNMHIYHTAQSAAPDVGIIEDLIAKCKPTWETWTYGRYGTSSAAGPYAVYGPHANVGLYNRCCYG